MITDYCEMFKNTIRHLPELALLQVSNEMKCRFTMLIAEGASTIGSFSAIR